MHCEFDCCVYNRGHRCILDEIQINRLGMCESCEMVAVRGAELEQCKEKRLREMAAGNLE